MAVPVPPVMRRVSSDEYRPLPWRRPDREALISLRADVPDNARRLALSTVAYVEGRRGTAATLRAIDAVAGGGFYDLPIEAELDDDAANDWFRRSGGDVVIDVQTHLIVPSRMGTPFADGVVEFLKATDPETWGGGVHPSLVCPAEWAVQVFGMSETAVAVLTSTPGRPGENVIVNPEIALCREIVDRYSGTGRLLTHTIVHPNVGGELDAMPAWRDELRPAGWKAYTMWEPPEWVDEGLSTGGWFLDDETIGIPFLQRVMELGPLVSWRSTKALAARFPARRRAQNPPVYVGPAAALFPEISFLVYHSGYEPDPVGEEGAYTEATRDRGVNRLVASLADAKIGPGANVYAELGSTWFMMIRRPVEAAHVLGKLLKAVGEDRILWGTDCIWYGSPQPLIDAFRAFTIPERMQEEFGYPALTSAMKQKILSLNAANVYGIDLDVARGFMGEDRRSWLTQARNELLVRLS